MNEIEKAQQEITEARDKLASAEARLSALSKVEKEYRAGEWVSALRESYFVIDGVGDVGQVINCNDDEDKEYQARGNAFPTESIAEAAKAHADWWREFDLSDEGGEWIMFVDGEELVTDTITFPLRKYTMTTFKSRENARAAIERLGGEQKVIEMLNAGRVFRFKWGGQ